MTKCNGGRFTGAAKEEEEREEEGREEEEREEEERGEEEREEEERGEEEREEEEEEKGGGGGGRRRKRRSWWWRRRTLAILHLCRPHTANRCLHVRAGGGSSKGKQTCAEPPPRREIGGDSVWRGGKAGRGRGG